MHFWKTFTRERTKLSVSLIPIKFQFRYITIPDNRYEHYRNNVDFIQKHIFPGSLLLSVNRVGSLMTDLGGA